MTLLAETLRDCKTSDEQDALINAALDSTSVIPDLCEWHSGGAGRIVFRIEVHMGRYAQRSLYPYMTGKDIADAIRATSREVEQD